MCLLQLWVLQNLLLRMMWLRWLLTKLLHWCACAAAMPWHRQPTSGWLLGLLPWRRRLLLRGAPHQGVF